MCKRQRWLICVCQKQESRVKVNLTLKTHSAEPLQLAIVIENMNTIYP